MLSIQIICRNNIYVGTGSITYDNTSPDRRKVKYNYDSIEHDIVLPNEMNWANPNKLIGISRLSETDILITPSDIYCMPIM